jgi:hypothetical protein
LGVRVRAHGG